MIDNSLVILVGISNYTNFHPLPAAFDNISSLRDIFRDCQYNNIKVFSDKDDAQKLLIAIKESAEEKEYQNVIFYYAGHGIIPESADDLFLTVTNSSHKHFEIDSISIEKIGKCFNKSTTCIYILDCCFSSLAFNKLPQNNFTVLASSSKTSPSNYPKEQILSSFTQEIIDIGKYGLNTNNDYITPFEIIEEIKSRHKKNNKPIPYIQHTGEATRFPLFKNNHGINQRYEVVWSNIPNKDYILDNINKALIVNPLVDSIAPKNIFDIFVFPPIYNKTENRHAAISQVKKLKEKEKSKKIEPLEILQDNNNYVIYGRRESGKTTMLNFYFGTILKNPTQYEYNIPLYVNFNTIDISKKNSIEDELRKSIGISQAQLNDLLLRNKCIIFIDNMDIKDEGIINYFNVFTKKYNNNKYIITCNESISESLSESGDKVKIHINVNKIFLHTFSRKEIFEFVDKWFAISTKTLIELKELKSKLFNIVILAQIPCNPVNICFLLWIFEKSQDVSRINNRFMLIEEFIQTILDKFPGRPASSGSKIIRSFESDIDYRNKEHFLSHLSGEMVKRNEFKFHTNDIFSVTQLYFQNTIGLKRFAVNKFIEYLVEKGILGESESEIYFKHKCIAEYFIAKQMNEDKLFLNYIIDETRYLLFINEIELYSSMLRNDYETVNILYKRLEKELSSKNYNEIVLNEQYLNFNYDEVNSIFAKDEVLISTLANDEAKNIITNSNDHFALDRILSDMSNNQDVIKNDISKLASIGILDKLILLSTIIRNSELIPIDKRYPLIKQIFYFWSAYMLNLLDEQDESTLKDNFIKIVSKSYKERGVSQKDILKEFNSKKDEIIEFTKIMIPIVFHYYISEAIGSEKLELAYQQVIDGDSPFIVRMNVAFIYAELKLPNHLSNLKKIYNLHSKSKYIGKLFYIRLVHFYIMQNQENKEKNDLLDFIMDIHIDHVSNQKIIGQKQRSMYKARLKQQFESERLKQMSASKNKTLNKFG